MFALLLLLWLCLSVLCQDLRLSDTVNVLKYLKEDVGLGEILLPSGASEDSDVSLPPDVIVDASLPPDMIVDASLPPDVMVDASLSPDVMVDASLSFDSAIDVTFQSDLMVDVESLSESLEEKDTLLADDYNEAIDIAVAAIVVTSPTNIDILVHDEQVVVNNVIFHEDLGSSNELLEQCITENAFIFQLNQEKFELFDINIKLSTENQQFYDVLKKYNIADPNALDNLLAATDIATTQVASDSQEDVCGPCPALMCPVCETCQCPNIPSSNCPSGCEDLGRQNELLKDKLETYDIKVKLSKNDQAIAEVLNSLTHVFTDARFHLLIYLLTQQANYQNCFLQSEANLLELKSNEKKLRGQIEVCENELKSAHRKASSVERFNGVVMNEEAVARNVHGVEGSDTYATTVARDYNESLTLSSTDQMQNIIKLSFSYMNSTISSIPVDEIKESGALFIGYTFPIILSFFNSILKLYIYYMTHLICSVIIPGGISMYSLYFLPLYNQHLSANVSQVTSVIAVYYGSYVGPIVASIAANEYFVLYVMPVIIVVTDTVTKAFTADTSYNEDSSDENSTLIHDFIVKSISLLYDVTSHYVLQLVKLIQDTHVFDEYTDLFAYAIVSIFIFVNLVLARRYIAGVMLLFFIILLAPLFMIMYVPMKIMTSIMKIFKKMLKPFTKKGKRKSAGVDADTKPKKTVDVSTRIEKPPAKVVRSNSNEPINKEVNEVSASNTSQMYADTASLEQNQLRYKLSP